MQTNSKIKIYTDGSCRTNPGGVGGWGVVITDDDQNIVSTMSGGEPNTTNSRMELVGVIKGLEVVHLYNLSDSVTVYSDSRYVIDNCIKFTNYPVDEADLWERYFTLKDLIKDISHVWLPGHRGAPLQEIADTLATNASGDLKEWLEQKSRNRKRKFNFTRGKTSSTKQDSKPRLKEILSE
jgi:ribonuclease HI